MWESENFEGMSSFCKRGVYSSEKNVLSKPGFEYVTSWLNVICLVSHGGSSTVISGFTGLFYNPYFLIELNSWTNTGGGGGDVVTHFCHTDWKLKIFIFKWETVWHVKLRWILTFWQSLGKIWKVFSSFH